jgi:hypothetical protein
VNAAEIVHQLDRQETRARTVRARIVGALGPLTILAGIVWAVAQPYRITLLHPHGQGFWWLLSEPPLFVILVGFLFRRFVAPGLVRDLEELGEP